MAKTKVTKIKSTRPPPIEQNMFLKPRSIFLSEEDQAEMLHAFEMRLYQLFDPAYTEEFEWRLDRAEAILKILEKIKTKDSVNWVHGHYCEKLEEARKKGAI